MHSSRRRGNGSARWKQREKKQNWKETYSRIMQLAKEELGESTPRKYLEKESWWWNDAVHQAVSEKRRLFREWQRTREENDQKRYKEAN